MSNNRKSKLTQAEIERRKRIEQLLQKHGFATRQAPVLKEKKQ